MTPSRLVLLGAGFIGVLAFGGYEHHRAVQLGAARAAAGEELRRLRGESDALRREQAITAAELATAEQQFGAATPSRGEGTAATYADEITSWLERVKTLRRLFEANPEQRIPEMKLLNDDDWLRVGQAVKFETDIDTRRALAAVRSAACQRFGAELSTALRAFAAAFPGQRPVSIHALVPFFASTPDPMVLARYEIQDPSGSPGSGPSSWFVQNNAPIDLAYDSRFRISSNSSFQDMGAHAWIPNYYERFQAAAKAYAAANAGRRPSRSTDALPFFDPPLTADAMAALRQSEGGR